MKYRLPVKIVVIKNNPSGMIKWEQMVFLGNPEYGCDLQPIDFVKAAEAMGMRGLRIEDPDACGAILDQALAEPGPVLVEAVVDANIPLLPPKRRPKYARTWRRLCTRARRDAGRSNATCARSRQDHAPRLEGRSRAAHLHRRYRWFVHDGNLVVHSGDPGFGDYAWPLRSARSSSAR